MKDLGFVLTILLLMFLFLNHEDGTDNWDLLNDKFVEVMTE